MPQFEDSPLSYLTRRDGRYQYRRRFPREVAEIVQRTEFRKALGTSSRAEALRLARRVSVEFDTVCEEALARAQAAGHAASPEQAEEVYRETAQEVLASLDGVVHSMTQNAVDTMTSRPDWRQELHAQRRFLEAQARGEVGHPLQMHPLRAKAAVRALDGVLSGEPVKTGGAAPGALGDPVKDTALPSTSAPASLAGTKTEADCTTALEAYVARVSISRGATARRVVAEVMQWPSTLAEQLQRLAVYGERRLAGGTAPNSVHTQVSAGIGVLREIPGWEEAELPKSSGLARALKGKVGPRKDATKPIPLERLRELVQKVSQKEDKAALVLLTRYGLRPGELLQEGPEALGSRVDVLGNSEVVFHAGLSGGKTESARRDLPVHPDDVPLFRTVLRDLKLPAGSDQRDRSRRANARGKRLYRMVYRYLGDGYKLYGIRHLVADLLRAAGATHDETGEVLGHSVQSHRVTSIYGGGQPLTRVRALLGKVREYSAEWPV